MAVEPTTVNFDRSGKSRMSGYQQAVRWIDNAESDANGSRKLMQVPSPGTLVALTEPPIASTSPLTIASRLVLSPKTVRNHVSNIFGK